jgi:hypothetical protein
MAPTSYLLRIFAPAAVAALLAPVAVHASEAKKASLANGPIVLAAPVSFKAAVSAVEKAVGVKGEKLPFGETPLAEGRSFSVDRKLADRLLEGSHGVFRKAGFYLFRYERSYGMAGDKDGLGLLATGDHRTVVRRVGTGSGHKGLGSETVVTWLDALAKDEPFELSEIGTDFLAGRFVNAPKDAAAVARRCAEFAPDLVAGRANTLDLLATEIKENRTLLLIW